MHWRAALWLHWRRWILPALVVGAFGLAAAWLEPASLRETIAERRAGRDCFTAEGISTICIRAQPVPLKPAAPSLRSGRPGPAAQP